MRITIWSWSARRYREARPGNRHGRLDRAQRRPAAPFRDPPRRQGTRSERISAGLAGERRALAYIELLAEAPREVLDVLPGDPAGARAARDCPFGGFGLELLRRHLEAEALGIGPHHRLIGFLVAGVKAEPQAESVGERDLLLDRFAGHDRGRALVFDHLARQQMPAVGRGVERDVARSSLDAAFEHRL